MDVIREETGLPSPVSSPKVNSTSHEDEVRPTEAVGDEHLPIEPSGGVHKKAASSRYGRSTS